MRRRNPSWIVCWDHWKGKNNALLYFSHVYIDTFFIYLMNRYIKRRVKSHHTALRVFRSDTPHPQEEVKWTPI
jgi:hypothetical protein